MLSVVIYSVEDDEVMSEVLHIIIANRIKRRSYYPFSDTSLRHSPLTEAIPHHAVYAAHAVPVCST